MPQVPSGQLDSAHTAHLFRPSTPARALGTPEAWLGTVQYRSLLEGRR